MQILGKFVAESKDRASGANENALPVYGVDRATGLTPNAKYQSKDTSKYKVIRPGMFAYNPMRLNIGSIAYCEMGHPPGLVSPDYVVFRCKDGMLDPKYLSYVINGPEWQHWVTTAGVGSVRIRIYYKELASMPFNPPTYIEQLAIAHILGSLDDKIELNRRMNGTLEAMAQALFKSWFVDFDPVIDNALAAGNPIPAELTDRAEVRRAALLGGTANREAAKPFPAAFQQTEQLGWIPVGWKVSPLNKQVLLTMGQSPPSTYYNKHGAGLPFHQGVTNYGERFPTHMQFSTAGNRYAEQGDILFSVRAPVGRINISDRKIIVGRGLAAMRHKKNLQAFLVYFLKHRFQTEDSIGSGTIFNAVNKKEMENIPFLDPNDTHAMQFDDIAQGFDKKIAINAFESESLTKLRDALLPKLISGELRIPDAEKLAEAALA